MADSDNFKTPSKPRLQQRASKQQNEVMIPESPFMKVIGYGTGVRVSLLDRATPRRVTPRSPWAVKKLSRRVHVPPEQAARLAREAQLLRRLSHPCVVGYRGVADGGATLLMEAATASLLDLVDARAESTPEAPFPLADIATVGVDIASALDYLHREERLLHGDLKSANVLIFGAFERAKLCDFGVSLSLDERLVARAGETYVGTEPWSAPEAVFEGEISNKTDVYSYALTLWEMFALEMPHASDLPDLDSECSESELDDSDDYFAAAMGTPPPVPRMEDSVMAEYRPFIEAYAVCSAVNAADRPDAAQCRGLFLAFCPRRAAEGQ